MWTAGERRGRDGQCRAADAESGDFGVVGRCPGCAALLDCTDVPETPPSLGCDTRGSRDVAPWRPVPAEGPVRCHPSDHGQCLSRSRMAMARAGRKSTCWLVQQRPPRQPRPTERRHHCPALQSLEVGQWVPMSPFGPPSEGTAFKVDSFKVTEWLLWTKPDGTWAWKLAPLEGGRTRLVKSGPRRRRTGDIPCRLCSGCS